jgi:hypothetical protein
VAIGCGAGVPAVAASGCVSRFSGPLSQFHHFCGMAFTTSLNSIIMLENRHPALCLQIDR